jgi:DNA repair exonuclease SbcCD ATPase subunit
MPGLQELKRKLDIVKGQREQVQLDLNKKQAALQRDTKSLKYHEQAKEIVRAVGKKTQEQLQFHISDITSLALGAVFDDPYKLEVEFVQRRNKTECDIYFVRGDNKIDPLSASGGGAVDVAAFALRIASWSLQSPHTRNTIILDEPMRFVSEDLKDRASQMIKEVSEKLGIQFIIVTHEPKLAAYADRIFFVKQKRKISKVTIKD